MLKPYRIGMMLWCCLMVAINHTAKAQSDVQGIDDIPEQHDQTTHYYSTPSIPVGSAADNADANPPELGGGDPGAPIDGGLSVLLAAGAAYGVRRMRKQGKVDNQQSADDGQ